MSKAPAAEAIKTKTKAEADVLRAVLARGNEKWNECPCGWFYKGARCPDKTCKEWLKTTGGKKQVKLYAHVNSEDYYNDGEKMGLEEGAISTFANWGYEIAFDAEVDLRTGKVKLLTVNGHKIQY